jgi:hypothetical protein
VALNTRRRLPMGTSIKSRDFFPTGECALIERVRAFMESEVAPLIKEYWARDKFPHESMRSGRKLIARAKPVCPATAR